MSEFKQSAKFQASGRIVEILPEQTFASGFVKREIVIETSRNEQYPSPVKVTFKKDDASKVETLLVGDGVDVEGYVSGRGWDGPKGRQYFVDLEAKSVMVTDKAAPAEKPTTAATWEELQKLGAAYGEGKDALVERCKKVGKAFKAMGAEDWAAIAADIVKAHGGEGSADAPEEEFPF